MSTVPQRFTISELARDCGRHRTTVGSWVRRHLPHELSLERGAHGGNVSMISPKGYRQARAHFMGEELPEPADPPEPLAIQPAAAPRDDREALVARAAAAEARCDAEMDRRVAAEAEAERLRREIAAAGTREVGLAKDVGTYVGRVEAVSLWARLIGGRRWIWQPAPRITDG